METLGNYRLGTEAYIPVSKRWSFKTGLLWEYRDNLTRSGKEFGKYDYWRTEYKDKAHFLLVPLMMSKRMSKQKQKNVVSYFNIGSYVALGLFGNSKGHDEYCQSNTSYYYGETYYDLIDKRSDCGAFSSEGAYKSRFDYGIELGFSFVVMRHYQIGTYLEIGLKDAYRKRKSASFLYSKPWHRGVGLSVGYQF